MVFLPPATADAAPFLRERQIAPEAAAALRFKDWLLIVRRDGALRPADWDIMRETVFNPGCLHYRCHGLRGGTHDGAAIWSASSLLFVNRRAAALRGATHLDLGGELFRRFPDDKVVRLTRFPRFDVPTVWETAFRRLRRKVLGPAKRAVQRMARAAVGRGQTVRTPSANASRCDSAG